MLGQGLTDCAFGNLGLDQAARHQCHAHASHDGLDDGVKLVKLQACQRVERVHIASLRPVHPGVRNGEVVQARVLHHIAWAVDGGAARAAGRGNQGHVLPVQIVGARAGPVAFAKQNRAVQMGALRVVAVGHKVQRDLRVLLLKLRQARNQPASAKGGQAGQVQRAAVVGAGDQLQRRRFQLRQQGAHGFFIALTRWGEGEALAAALKQIDAHPFLQFLYLFADRTLRQVQGFCRT